ncbi:MAG: 4Fe-4S dicluster domain-containing protein [Coriobacteriales bacterium]|nr:4Fe-4S dicluster domain-containing protein [Coriobacteriales bacterium]
MNNPKAFLVDVSLCIGCRACEMACRNENLTPSHIHWRHVIEIEEGVFLSMACNHCENPECFRVCPERAFNKRHDGIVEINSSLCNGCRRCVTACPYHAPQYNASTNKVTRCNMCATRQDRGEIPACVEACPTGALSLILLNDSCNSDVVDTIQGFTDIRLTRPSIRFHQIKTPKRWMISDDEKQ